MGQKLQEKRERGNTDIQMTVIQFMKHVSLSSVQGSQMFLRLKERRQHACCHHASVYLHFDAYSGTLNKASLKTGSGQLHTHLGS